MHTLKAQSQMWRGEGLEWVVYGYKDEPELLFQENDGPYGSTAFERKIYFDTDHMGRRYLCVYSFEEEYGYNYFTIVDGKWQLATLSDIDFVTNGDGIVSSSSDVYAVLSELAAFN